MDATAVERAARAFFTLSMLAMEGEDPLRPSALRALLSLEAHGSLTVGQLAGELALSQSATSRLVDRLVHQGLVDRAASPLDRRQLMLAATAAGSAVVGRLVARRRAAMLPVLDAMTAADRTALERGLAAFARAAEKVAPGATP